MAEDINKIFGLLDLNAPVIKNIERVGNVDYFLMDYRTLQLIDPSLHLRCFVGKMI